MITPDGANVELKMFTMAAFALKCCLMKMDLFISARLPLSVHEWKQLEKHCDCWKNECILLNPEMTILSKGFCCTSQIWLVSFGISLFNIKN